MQTRLIMQEKCLVCNIEGDIIPVEKLPNGGVLYHMIHKNGQVHEWGQFPSIGILFKAEKATPPLRRLICPKCRRRGRISGFISNPRKPFKIDYVVVHGKIGGTWGKKKNPKVERCYITDPQQRQTILKKLRRVVRPQ